MKHKIMKRRTFLKKIPFVFIGGIIGIKSIERDKLPLGYISNKAKKIKKEIGNNYATKKQSKQLLDELLDNSNPTEAQFEKIFDKCVISADTLYRLSVHGFNKK